MEIIIFLIIFIILIFSIKKKQLIDNFNIIQELPCNNTNELNIFNETNETNKTKVYRERVPQQYDTYYDRTYHDNVFSARNNFYDSSSMRQDTVDNINLLRASDTATDYYNVPIREIYDKLTI